MRKQSIFKPCIYCGAKHLVKIGYNITLKGKRPRYRCQECAKTQY